MIDLTSDFFHPRKICSVYLITPSHGERLPFQKKWKIYEDLFRLRFSTKIEKGSRHTVRIPKKDGAMPNLLHLVGGPTQFL